MNASVSSCSCVDEVVTVGSTGDAELVKLLENKYRHVNIALVNELAMYAADLGLDIWSAIDAASTKPFGYSRFTPGPGVGGHCLPVDPSYLSWEVKRRLGRTFRFVELANDVNAHMPDYVVRRVIAGLNARGLALQGRRVLLVGLSYKRNTGDARETPARPIAAGLVALGAEVLAVDPHVSDQHVPPDVRRVALDPEVVRSAAAVVILVDHDDVPLDVVTAHASYVLDTRRCLDGDAVEHL